MLNVALYTLPGQETLLQDKVEYIWTYNRIGALVLSYQLTMV